MTTTSPRSTRKAASEPTESILTTLGEIASFAFRTIRVLPATLRYPTEVVRQLAILLPNNVITLASNDPKTSAFFKDWTGQTQKNLEERWKAEGFTKSANPANGVWTRTGTGSPLVTSPFTSAICSVSVTVL